MSGDVIVLERDDLGMHRWRRIDGDGEIVTVSAGAWVHEADCFDDLVAHNADYEGHVTYDDLAAETDGGTVAPGNAFLRGPVVGYTIRPGVWSRRDPREDESS